MVPGSGKERGSKEEFEVASEVWEEMEVADSRRMRLAGVEVRKKLKRLGRLGMALASRGRDLTNL